MFRVSKGGYILNDLWKNCLRKSVEIWKLNFIKQQNCLGYFIYCSTNLHEYFFFLFRKGQFLNVRGEKTSESLFYQALTKTTSAWFPRKLLNYCCVESLLIENKGIALILLSLDKNTCKSNACRDLVLSRLNSCKSYCPWCWFCCIVELKFSGDSYAPFYHLFLEIDDDSKPLTVDQREMVSFKIQFNYCFQTLFVN